MNTINSYELIHKSQHAENPFIPIKFIQTSSKEVSEKKAYPGMIFNSYTQEISDYLFLVLIAARKEFRVWEDGKTLSPYPKYVSTDMQNLIELNPQTGAQVNSESLHNSEAWRNRFNNPKAKTQYFFLGIVPDLPKAVSFRIGGLGFSATSRFLESAMQSKKQLFEFVTRITIHERGTNYGTKYIPRLEMTDFALPHDWPPEKSEKLCQKFLRQSQDSSISL